MAAPEPTQPPLESSTAGEPANASPELQPLTLSYDNYSAAKDPRARRVLPAFLLGMLVAGIFQGILFGLIKRFGVADGGPLAGMDGFVVPVGFAVVLWLPASMSLGITIWLRTKILKEVRFAKFTSALLMGFVLGAIPWSVPTLFDVLGWHSIFWFFAMLGANIILPAIAGVFLCYRSNLRD